MPTSLDLYRELQMATPFSLQYLLQNLFAANTFWELKADNASAKQNSNGTWQVNIDVQARKLIKDSIGVEKEMPMNDWVEIGIYAANKEGKKLGTKLHLQQHRILSGKQRITVIVSKKPSLAGIDPNHLLIDLKMNDNIKKIRLE